MNVNGSFFDIDDFILPEVFVRWEFVPWSNVLGSHNKVLRTIVYWADLEYEVPWRTLSPYPPRRDLRKASMLSYRAIDILLMSR